MAKVVGVGGVFFKSADPAGLGAWYQKWLGIPVESWGGVGFQPGAMPPGGATVWSPFPADTKYFGDGAQTFMINLIVDDLDGALAQVKEGGATVAGAPESMEYGRFGWFVDPDGNRVELWQPAEAPGA
ncbi:MAG: VOC family protein [Candidatus Eisenbacteria bacterium]|uniref:VOC family protein n=1 Tax=Eiseniibacteriota bacterium TaxID=2212470 RepID=A0A956M281_UNCEI|nr:VOC family protein [Candidatus Eisenbacteria bacterium]